MIAVVGISASSAGRSWTARSTRSAPTCSPSPRARRSWAARRTLPDEAVAMIGRIGPVHVGPAVACRATPRCTATTRSPTARPAASPCSRPTSTCSTRSAHGAQRGLAQRGDRALPGGGARGAAAAERLGIGRRRGVAGVARREWFTVVGILDPVPLAPELDRPRWSAGPARRDASASTAPDPHVYMRADGRR